MNRDEILARLRAQLQQMNRQFEVVAASGVPVPKLEMDRMLGDIRATYELFTVLSYVNTFPPQEAPAVTREEIMASLSVEEKQPGPVIEKKPEPVVEKKPEPIIEKKPEPVAGKKQEPVAEKLYQKHADSSKETINDQLKKQAESTVPFYKTTEAPPESVADKFRQKKIDDLRKAIPLHEKFMYINELFEGDNGPYNSFIEAVSHCTSRADADALISQAATRYNWDSGSRTYARFIELIQRRFI